MVDVIDFHAHVYFDVEQAEAAQRICETCRDKFGVEMGRMHARPVGPHPDGSCQLSFGPDKFADVTTWLALNRNGLVVFIHPNTGNALADHRDHAIWMGAVRPLNLSIFDAPSGKE
ncbi:MAG: aromatic ring-cleaving dioxygenase [Hyphomicrobiaceae bacterium]